MASNVPTLNNFKLPTLNNNRPPSRRFSRSKVLLKKSSLRKCLLNKLLKLNRECLGSWSYIFLKLVIFMTKQKFSKTNLRVHYFMLKMLKKAMYYDFLTKFNPKMQDFKRVLDLTWNKESDFFSWLSNIKNFVIVIIAVVITFYSPSCLDQETAKGPFDLQVKLPPAHLSTTHGGGFILSL